MASTESKSGETKSTDDGSRVMKAVCIGAILGGVWGWLYLTSRGNKVRDRVDPALDRVVDALDKVQSLRTAVKSLAVLTVIAGCLCVPNGARAGTFLVPWIAGNAGAPSGVGWGAFGASAGVSSRGIVDVDLDCGYSPGSSSRVASTWVFTAMTDVTLGVPLGPRGGTRVRPYVTGGAGLMRSHTDSVLFGLDATHNDVGVAFGGGVVVLASHHVGVRADLRRMQSLQETTFDPLGPRRLGYWRTSIGMVIR